MPDREAQDVELAEHRRELPRGVSIHDELPVCARPSKPQCVTVRRRSSESGTGQPGCQKRASRLAWSGAGKRSDRRVVRLERDERERQGEDSKHGAAFKGAASSSRASRWKRQTQWPRGQPSLRAGVAEPSRASASMAGYAVPASPNVAGTVGRSNRR